MMAFQQITAVIDRRYNQRRLLHRSRKIIRIRVRAFPAASLASNFLRSLRGILLHRSGWGDTESDFRPGQRVHAGRRPASENKKGALADAFVT